MVPNQGHRSFPYLEYPKYRDVTLKLPQQWLKGKQLQDGAEGLWRVHNGLYDLSKFISSHPGGKEWLTTTRGTDITEGFETHHLKGVAESILPKYFVKNVDTPRNSPFTFKEDGFYNTLKVKVMEDIKRLPKNMRLKSDRVTDMLLMGFIISSPICCWALERSWVLGIPLLLITGYLLSGVLTCSHNYFHRADSWRMYLFNLSGMCYSDWRVSHAMSHHLFTNTLMDLELTMFEPYIYFMPYQNKNMVMAYLSTVYWPVVYMSTSINKLFTNMIAGILKIEGKSISWENWVTMMLLGWMYLVSGASVTVTLCAWAALQLFSSLNFVFFGLLAGHHSDTNFFDGDIPREQYIDWGVHQLDTVIEREDYHGDHFRTLTQFGAHTLHHLFPTLDHAELEFLMPTLLSHVEKFDLTLRSFTFRGAFISQTRQILRNKPNDIKLRDKKCN